MGRRKAAPQQAPTTLPEAIATLERYLATSGEIDRTKADADRAILAIQTSRDELVAPMKAQAEDLFLQLRAWWGVAGPDMAKGRKSIELAGALIGIRTTTPSLKLPRGMKVEQAVAFVQAIVADYPGAGNLLRVKTELEKPALIKLLRSSTAVGPVVERISRGGFTVAQRDEFFIDRAAPKEPDPETVDTPAPAIAEVAS